MGSNKHWNLNRIIFRLRQLGCPFAQANNFLVRATLIYRSNTQPGKFKLEVSLHQSYHTSYKYPKSCPNWLQINNINQVFNFTFILLFGHVWASSFMVKFDFPDNQEKKIVAAWSYSWVFECWRIKHPNEFVRSLAVYWNEYSTTF